MRTLSYLSLLSLIAFISRKKDSKTDPSKYSIIGKWQHVKTNFTLSTKGSSTYEGTLIDYGVNDYILFNADGTCTVSTSNQINSFKYNLSDTTLSLTDGIKSENDTIIKLNSRELVIHAVETDDNGGDTIINYYDSYYVLMFQL